MADHVIDILKEEVRKVPQRKIGDTPYLKREDESLFKNHEDSTCTTSLLTFKEVAYVVGKIKMFRRVFIHTEDAADYSQVGWVMDNDMDACMICGTTFFLFDRHHCRACGDLVCENCSAEHVQLTEFMSWGPLRVCQMCHFGQDNISVNPLRQARQQALLQHLHLQEGEEGERNRTSDLVSHLTHPEDIRQSTGEDGAQHVMVSLATKNGKGTRKPTMAELQLLSSVSGFQDGGRDQISRPMGMYERSGEEESESDEDEDEDRDEREARDTVAFEREVSSGSGYGSAGQGWLRRKPVEGEDEDEEEGLEQPEFTPLTVGALQALQDQLEREEDETDSSEEEDEEDDEEDEGEGEEEEVKTEEKEEEEQYDDSDSDSRKITPLEEEHGDQALR